MNLTKSRLQQIILEELQYLLKEQDEPAAAAEPKPLSAIQMRKMANALCFKQGRVWFGGGTTDERKKKMGRARYSKKWRCPANKNLGFKDWSDARKLAKRGDSAKFQQFIQSKKGAAPGQQGQPELKVEAVVATWVKAWKERAGSESAKKEFMRRLRKDAQTGSDIMKQAAPLILKQIEAQTPGPAEREVRANLQGVEGSGTRQEGGFQAEIQKYNDLFNNLGGDKQRQKEFLTTLENTHSNKKFVKVFLALRKHIEFYMGQPLDDQQMLLQQLIDDYKEGFQGEDALNKLKYTAFLQLPAIKQAIEAIKAEGASTISTNPQNLALQKLRRR